MARRRDLPEGFNTIHRRLLGLHLEEETGIQGTAQGHCGLENQGSTCYLNSVLQTLFMTKEFRKQVKRLDRDGVSSDGNLVKRLNKLFNKLKEREEPAVSTTGIRKSLGIINVHKQADTAELLHLIIRKTPGSSKLFKGTMKTTRKCWSCRDKHESFEDFLEFPVCFEDSQYVEDAVKAHIDRERGVFPMTCFRCKRNTDWKKKTEMINFPKILIIQLRRFEMSSSGFRKNDLRVKIDSHIKVSSVEYNLYAIIHHSGTYDAGHYYADIKCEDETWRRFDDESVSESFRNRIFRYMGSTLSSKAYLLVYRRGE